MFDTISTYNRNLRVYTVQESMDFFVICYFYHFMHNFAAKKPLKVKVNLLICLKVNSIVYYIFIETISLSGFTHVNYELCFSSESRQTIVVTSF